MATELHGQAEMRNLSFLTTLCVGLAAHGQPIDPVTLPPLVEAPWTRLGDPVPAGFRVRSEPTWGLFGAGVALLTLSYVPVTIGGFASGQPLNAVPIVGPMLTYRPSTEPWLGGLFNAGSQLAIGANMVLQVGGAVMLVMGLGLRRSWLERIPTSPGLQVVPAAPGSTLGVSVSGQL